MSEEVKLDPEEAELVKGVIAQAYEEMETQARAIGGQGDAISVAYQGSGTGRAVDTYASLGGAGAALAAALDALSQDLGVTVAEGRDMDSNALAAINRGGAGVPDAGISQQI